MKQQRPVRIRATDHYVVFKLADELDEEAEVVTSAPPIGEYARRSLATIVSIRIAKEARG